MPRDRNRGSQKPRQEHSQGNMTRSRSLPARPTVCDLIEHRAGSQHLLLSSGVGFQKVASDQHRWLEAVLVSLIVRLFHSDYTTLQFSISLPSKVNIPHLESHSFDFKLYPLLYLILITVTLEEGTTTHPSILAWRIPWTEEPGGLQSVGLQRVGCD